MRRTQNKAFVFLKCRFDPVVPRGHGQHSEKSQKAQKHEITLIRVAQY